MQRLITKLKPPLNWRPIVVLALGVFCGLSLFLVYISRAPSYLSDDPATCVNCHIMTPQYASWAHSAHRNWATCNDCHVPQDNVIESYIFKAQDGLRHAYVFTLRAEPQAIRITDAGKRAVQSNCVRCHRELVLGEPTLADAREARHARANRYCWECHRYSPHGRARSLASAPFARAPLPESPVPDWFTSNSND